MRKIEGAMPEPGDILHCYDDWGNLRSVIVPAWLWKKIKHEAIRVMHEKEDVPPEPIEDFKRFLAGWNSEEPGGHDHYYRYSPHIKCPVCRTETGDWQWDNPRKFRLLDVEDVYQRFRCQECGALLVISYLKHQPWTNSFPEIEEE